MPRYARHGAAAGGASVSEVRPGIYEWMGPYVEWEYERSGDPRQRMSPHDDGEGGVCRGAGCDHPVPPSSDSDHPAVRRLVDYEAGLPIVVPHHIACGQQWTGGGWTDPAFDLPWKAKTVRHVRVTAADGISPA